MEYGTMSDPVKEIQAKYKSQHRYANFGHVIRSIKVDGFRGIRNFDINFDFPIIAFSGLNGAGKSTIGQLVICGYKKPLTAKEYRRYYVKDFFPVSVADPNPFSEDARILYIYETNDHNNPREVTISRSQSQWSGYKRQPEKYCYYVGFTLLYTKS
jgi:predicted ATP-dependent endonuclease of OLD family